MEQTVRSLCRSHSSDHSQISQGQVRTIRVVTKVCDEQKLRFPYHAHAHAYSNASGKTKLGEKEDGSE